MYFVSSSMYRFLFQVLYIRFSIQRVSQVAMISETTQKRRKNQILNRRSVYKT